MKPPATIIVGEVVRLHDQLNWYERLPLFRQAHRGDGAPKAQAGALSARLGALGGRGNRKYPTIEFRPAARLTPRSTAPSPTSPPTTG